MASTQEIPDKSSTEVRNGGISLDALLDAAETISGTPTIASTPSGLTFANIAANSVDIIIKGLTVATGRAVQFRVSGGTSGITYSCKATVTTNATPAQTIDVPFRLLVIDE
jgi:hypothetical protein